MEQNPSFLFFDNKTLLKKPVKNGRLKSIFRNWGVLIAYFLFITIGIICFFVGVQKGIEYLHILFSGVLAVTTFFSLLFLILKNENERKQLFNEARQYQETCGFNLNKIIKELEYGHLYYQIFIFENKNELYNKYRDNFSKEKEIYIEIAKSEKISDDDIFKHKINLILLRIMKETDIISETAEIKKIIHNYQQTSKNVNQFNKDGKKGNLFYEYHKKKLVNELFLFKNFYTLYRDALHTLNYLEKKELKGKHTSLSNGLKLKKSQFNVFLFEFLIENSNAFITEAKNEFFNGRKTFLGLPIIDETYQNLKKQDFFILKYKYIYKKMEFFLYGTYEKIQHKNIKEIMKIQVEEEFSKMDETKKKILIKKIIELKGQLKTNENIEILNDNELKIALLAEKIRIQINYDFKVMDQLYKQLKIMGKIHDDYEGKTFKMLDSELKEQINKLLSILPIIKGIMTRNMCINEEMKNKLLYAINMLHFYTLDESKKEFSEIAHKAKLNK